MKNITAKLIRDEEEAMQTAIESRAAQKLFDDGPGSFVDGIIDLMRDTVSCPPDMMRSASQEDVIEEMQDYFIGMFLEQYAAGYIKQYRSTRREIH